MTSRTKHGTTTYAWDALGHLTQVASAEATLTYAYGISGMRERVTRETSASTSWTESVWDGAALVAERDSDGTLYRYVWGPDRTPLALEVTRLGETAALYSYHVDAAGSVIALTGPDGTVVASYRYGPYGELTYTGGSDAALAERNPLRYRSYYYDTATALYYLPARYYEPATARFLSPDPAAPSAGDPLSLNAYAYCVGDPVNLEDPSGAIADWDGNGTLDRSDSLMNTASRTKDPEKRRAIARRASLIAPKDVRRTRWTGRLNLSLKPTAPDAWDWLFDGIGAGCEAVEIGAIAFYAVTAPETFSLSAVLALPVCAAAIQAETAIDTISSVRTGFLFWAGEKSLGDVVVSSMDRSWKFPGGSLIRELYINPDAAGYGILWTDRENAR